MLKRILLTSLLLLGASTVSAQVIITPSRSIGGGAGPGTGDVVGPASAVDNNLACYDGATGKLIKDCLVAVTDFLSSSATSTQNGSFGNILLRDDTNPSHYLTITAAEDLSAGRILSIITGDAARSLTFTANASIGGTNTGDVTLAGTPDYITISGQVITRGLIDLTTDVTGTLPVANGGSGAATLTGPLKGNGTSAFTIAVSSDIIGLWSGTCNGSSFLRGDGACASPAGSGDVVGPASATSGNVVTFDGTTGKLIQDSGLALADIIELPGTPVQGDLLYFTTAGAPAILAKNTTATRYLSNTGSNNDPAWAQINLANGVTGILPAANSAPRYVFYNAGICIDGTAYEGVGIFAAATGPTIECRNGASNTTDAQYSFADDDTGRFLSGAFDIVESSLTSITLHLRWSSAANTGDINVLAAVSCTSPNGASNDTLVSTTGLVDTADGTANDENVFSGALTITGCVSGSRVRWQLGRDRNGDASDTLTGQPVKYLSWAFEIAR